MWQVDHGGSAPTHIFPLHDLRDHVVDGRPCWCAPDETEDGIVHNAADGREQYERGERKPQ